MFALGFICGIATLTIVQVIDLFSKANTGKSIREHLTEPKQEPYVYDPKEEGDDAWGEMIDVIDDDDV